MNLSFLKDQELLSQTKEAVKSERLALTQVLHHLKEVERRKLFCDLGHQSLFEYCIKDLGYSNGQAGRRIQAMRLLKEIPEIESKIEKGSLNLSHLSQVQSHFREKQKTIANSTLSSAVKKESYFSLKLEKKDLLKKVEGTSTRESEKIILKTLPPQTLPKEKERVISEEHTEVRFIMTEDLKNQINEIKALLGPKALNMNFAELISYMANETAHSLKIKKFGKKRTNLKTTKATKTNTEAPRSSQQPSGSKAIRKRMNSSPHTIRDLTPHDSINKTYQSSAKSSPAPELSASKNMRYISRGIKDFVWHRDKGQCQKCCSRLNINFDHIKPVALGGESTPDNLRLLCFNCNQRQSIKTFGRYQFNLKS